VDQALERIDSGGYGICLVCGSGIADERLEALPATALCRSCAGRRRGRSRKG
jgi:RNA polymerase-binding transcription factor DksA